MTEQHKKEPDFSLYVISDFYEETEDSDHYLYFRLNDVKYVMLIEDKDGKVGPIESEIITVNHEEGRCPRCDLNPEEDGFCHYFSNHTIELFNTLLPYSKNRLRWISRHVFY